MKPGKMQAVIGGKCYNTETADLIAGNDWWDGHNFERRGTQQYLYRTQKGNYFYVKLSQWEGSANYIEPCTEGEAVAFWEVCDRHGEASDYAVAFPQLAQAVEEA